MIKKHLANKGIATYIYYYAKHRTSVKRQVSPAAYSDDDADETGCKSKCCEGKTVYVNIYIVIILSIVFILWHGL